MYLQQLRCFMHVVSHWKLIIEQIENLSPVKGRMEKVETDLPIQIFIDYAHTPDAIEKAINAAIPYKKSENKLIFLVGTGGNRDKSKRPTMAEKASVADYVILTTDDPRYEEYDSITGDLAKGMIHENLLVLVTVLKPYAMQFVLQNQVILLFLLVKGMRITKL